MKEDIFETFFGGADNLNNGIKDSLKSRVMAEHDKEMSKIKPALRLGFLNFCYLNHLTEILISKGIMTKEECNTIEELAKKESSEQVDDYIKCQRKSYEEGINEAMNEMFGDD